MYLYLWAHTMLKAIVQGVQGAHCTSELPLQNASAAAQATWAEWNTKHKTIILLDGGNTATLEKRYLALQHAARTLNWPVARFDEDWATLGGIMTACGAVMPPECCGYDSPVAHAARAKMLEFGLTDPLDAALDHERFNAKERMWLVTSGCRLAG